MLRVCIGSSCMGMFDFFSIFAYSTLEYVVLFSFIALDPWILECMQGVWVVHRAVYRPVIGIGVILIEPIY